MRINECKAYKIWNYFIYCTLNNIILTRESMGSCLKKKTRESSMKGNVSITHVFATKNSTELNESILKCIKTFLS